MADYESEVRIHVRMDNKAAKKGAKEIEGSLEHVEEKAGEKAEVGIVWDEKAQREAEENIDRILAKKKELAKEPVAVSVDTEEPRVADMDWTAHTDYAAKISAEIEAIERAAEESTKEAEKADEHYNRLRVDVEEYAKSLKELEEQGQYFGDADYDRVYLAWKNADDAVREYVKDLNRLTAKSQAETGEDKKAQREAEALKEAQKAEKELEAVRSEAVVENQDLVSLMQEQEAVMERIAVLKKAGVTDGYQEYEELRDRLAEISEEIRNQREGFSEAESSGRKAFDAIGRSAKKAGGILTALKKKLKSLALSLLLFSQIRKGFNAMADSMKEGFRNLAKYSGDYNTQMSALQSSCAQLKNGLAAAFEPIVSMVLPYLTQFVGMLVRAADAVSQFLAALGGKSTYTKAKKQTIDYAKSLDTATKSAKKALAAFDELNVLNGKDGGTVSGGEATGADAFETGTVSSQISGFAGEVLTAIQPFRDAIGSWWQDVDFEPLLMSFERLRTACEPFAGYLADGLLWFLENILLPLGSWVIADAVPAFFDLLSAALDVLNVILTALQPYGIWLWENFLQPMAAWCGDAVINGLQFLTEKLQQFSQWCREDKANVENMAEIFIGFLSGIMTYYAVKKIVKAIGLIGDALNGFKGIAAALCSPVGLAALAIGMLTASIIMISKNWSKLNGMQKAATILGGLAAAAITAAVAIAVFHTAWSVGVAAAAIIGGLAALGISTAILSSSSGGNKQAVSQQATDFYGSNDFSGSPLPMLAEGAVIQGGRPFAAILGDQPRGQTNIETPLATMVEAFKIAQAESGGGDLALTVLLDGKTVYESVVKRDQMYRKQTGSSAFWA